LARPTGHPPRQVQLAWLIAVGFCGCYLGTARDLHPGRFEEPGWVLVPNVPLIRQADQSDCGAAALAMMMTYWGQWTNVEEITLAYPVDPGHGIKARALRDFARARGFNAYVIEGDLKDIIAELRENRPVIVGLIKVHSNRLAGHYEVVVGVNPDAKRIATLDPARGWRENTFDGFSIEWNLSKNVTLIVFKAAEGQRSNAEAALITAGSPVVR